VAAAGGEAERGGSGEENVSHRCANIICGVGRKSIVGS
jgi:hypothetical protein